MNEVDPDDTIWRLRDDPDLTRRGIGIAANRRALCPHVTLGRVGDRASCVGRDE